jgi:hypothetical protein
MKPTEDVSQFPENGMKTPETKLTVKTTDGAYQLDSLLSFNHANREVLRITHDGRMIIGEGLSTEEATQEAAKLLIASFEERIQEMVDARIAAELARLRAENKLLCAAQKISEDSDGAIVMEVISLRARAEKAEADTARLDWLGKSSYAKFYEGTCVWRINGDEKTEGDTLRDAIDAAMKEAGK